MPDDDRYPDAAAPLLGGQVVQRRTTSRSLDLVITKWPTGVVLTVTIVFVTAACGQLPGAGQGGLQTLAKAEGGQQSVPDTSDTFASLFIAYDSASAQRLWDDNVSAGLPRRDGDPIEDGLYGGLADVDFDEQVVGLWSAGQSGSCPGWLGDVRTGEDGALPLDRDEDTGGQDGCTDDYNPYRTVVALDRDAVPEADALQPEGFTGDPPIRLRVFVAEYPRA